MATTTHTFITALKQHASVAFHYHRILLLQSSVIKTSSSLLYICSSWWHPKYAHPITLISVYKHEHSALD